MQFPTIQKLQASQWKWSMLRLGGVELLAFLYSFDEMHFSHQSLFSSLSYH